MRLSAIRAVARRHPTALTVAGSLATAAVLVWLLSGRQEEFTEALSGVALWVILLTALLQALALVSRSEAWHLSIQAAGEPAAGAATEPAARAAAVSVRARVRCTSMPEPG